jgi:nitrogen fixation/metabolism regulation signal transduction histidine kinase
LFNKAASELFRIRELSNLVVLDQIYPDFSKILMKMKSAEQKLIKIDSGNEIKQLSIKATEFKILENPKKLVSIQNIKNELEDNELDSWQKLIRVLTHEIMNSTAPITSSIKIITRFFKNEKTDKPKQSGEIDNEIIQHTIRGLGIIEERSEGLTNFVDKYRSLTNLPKPKFSKFPVSEMFESIRILMEEKIKANNIICEQHIYPQSLVLNADKKMIEQVIINLIINSVNALEGIENKKIELKSFLEFNERIVIQVVDNGKGIPKEIIDKVFMPFFTTKEEGSGIGLSLSRQIMRLHGGTIKVQSEPLVETIFTLRF